MVRNLFGILLALVGAAAAAFGPMRLWYGDRLGRSFRVEDIFTATGITDIQAGLYTGLFMPMLVAGGLTLIGSLFRSRFVVGLASGVVLGVTSLWMIRQGQDSGSLTAGGDGLGEGVGYSAGGGLLLLIGALVMRGRHVRARRDAQARVDDGDRYGYGDGQAPAEPQAPPQSYGSFGTTHGPHGAYLAGEGYRSPPPRYNDYEDYEDDSTPPEEWDPWNAGRSQPGATPGQPQQGPQQQPPPRPDTQRIPRRPDHRRRGYY
jgi:hypothetical protein